MWLSQWLCFNYIYFFWLLQYFQRNPRLAESSKRMKSQIWSSVVTIVLVEARNMPPDTDNTISEPFVRFRYVEHSNIYIYLLFIHGAEK